MRLRTVDDVEKLLCSYYQVASRTTGKGITVQRMAGLMNHLGNPQDSLRVIHVAGTSGKTSTTYFITELIKAAGKTVGHTVSPHITSLTERVQINGSPLPEKEFLRLIEEFDLLVQGAPETPSWFEYMMAFAIWTFARKAVNYAVIETGLGGLHDASNVCSQANKVCVITDIGIDHTEILGSTIEEIAEQKAGIIHPGNPVLIMQQDPEIIETIKAASYNATGSRLYLQEPETLQKQYGDLVRNLPEYQQRNWLLALSVYQFLSHRDSLPDLTSADLYKTQITVPGRMEHIFWHGKEIILDGAHNGPKMTACVHSLRQQYNDIRIPVLCAIKNNKDDLSISRELAAIASSIIATKFTVSQDWPIQAKDPSELANVFRSEGIKSAEAVTDPLRAFDYLLRQPAPFYLVTGSIYLVSQLRSWILEQGGTFKTTKN